MKLKGIIDYDCTECMLGAPYEICWQTQCINYSFKKNRKTMGKSYKRVS